MLHGIRTTVFTRSVCSQCCTVRRALKAAPVGCRRLVTVAAVSRRCSQNSIRRLLQTNSVKAYSSRPVVEQQRQYTDDLSSASDYVPDALAPADSFITWQRDGAVRIRMEGSGPAAEKPITLMTYLRETVERAPNLPALATKIDGTWNMLSYEQYYNEINQAARGMLELGLEPRSGVGIIGYNAAEWNISCLASIFAGGYATGMYTTNSPDTCHYIADKARCNIMVVEDDKQLQKILSIRSKLPHLKAIIQYRGQPDKLPGVYSWSEMMEIGRSRSMETELKARIQLQAPNKGCVFVFTSGTTGNSKGVMLSHDNLIWISRRLRDVLNTKFGEPCRLVSYLPLSHAAAVISDIFAPISVAGLVYFTAPDALKGALVQWLNQVRPTHFFGVPRVWEKVQEGITTAEKNSGPVKRRLLEWARDAGLKGNLARMSGTKAPFSSRLAETLVLKRIHKALGLDHCSVIFSSAAPISPSTLNFLCSLGLSVTEVYGMSEASGPHTCGLSNANIIGSVGREIPGTETEIADQDENGVGELLLRGRHICMGYLDMKEQTLAAFGGPAAAYLHTGDLGRKDSHGYLYVTGRIKEILVTAGGENIPSVHIETAIKERLPIVSSAVLIGDRRHYLTMLITVKTDVDLETLRPLDTLTADAVAWCRQHGSNATTVSDVISDVNLNKIIRQGFEDYNKVAISNPQRIQKWTILPADFSVAGGELGPTLKLRRHFVIEKYSQTIESMYAVADTR